MKFNKSEKEMVCRTACERVCSCGVKTRTPHFTFLFSAIAQAITACCHGHSIKWIYRILSFFSSRQLSSFFLLLKNPQSPSVHSISHHLFPKHKGEGTKDTTLQLGAARSRERRLANCSLDRGKKKSIPQPPLHSQNLPHHLVQGMEKKNTPSSHNPCSVY